MATLKNTIINDTGYLTLPNGTDAQRPTAANGQMRYNTTSGQMEIYNNSWIKLSTDYSIETIIIGGGGGGGASYNVAYGGGGGGGGGGYSENVVTVTPGSSYSLVVGGGGAGATISATGGTDGTNSTGFGFTSRGGGGGGSFTTAWAPSNSGATGGGGGRDQGTYGLPNSSGTEGQGYYGAGAVQAGCGSAGGGGGSGNGGYTGRNDCNNIRWELTSCGGLGRVVTWSGNDGGIIATTIKGYSVVNNPDFNATYSIDYSDDGYNWTSGFTGNLRANNQSGVITGSTIGNGSYGRHYYWRYRCTGIVTYIHPKLSRLWLEDANGNQYLLRRWIADNTADKGGNYGSGGIVSGYFKEGTWYGGGGGGSYEGNADYDVVFANAGQLPERGGRGSACSGGVAYAYGSDGDANSGFGGGGANHNWYGGGYNGGSGIVIIRYYGPQRGSGGTVTTVNGYTIHTFTSSGTFTA